MTCSPGFRPSSTIHCEPGSAADLHGARCGLAAFADDEHGVALGSARHGLLRQQHRTRDLALHEARSHVHARQEARLRVGNLGAQRDLGRGRVHGQVGEQQAAPLGQLGPVVEHDAHRGRIGSGLAGDRGGLTQPVHIGHSLRGVHVHRIDLLDERELGRLDLRYQRPFGDQRAPDAARDRRRDRGIAKVELSRSQCRACSGHIGLGLRLRGLGVDVILLADRVGCAQRLEARGLGGGLHGVGLRLGQRGLGAVHGGLVGRGIDLEQHLAGLHVAAFAEEALLHDARHPRPHLRHARGLDAPGQFGRERHGLRRHGDHAHFGRWGCAGAGPRGRLLLPPTRSQRQYQGCCDQGRHRSNAVAGTLACCRACRASRHLEILAIRWRWARKPAPETNAAAS
jgi:hypothetical protein